MKAQTIQLGPQQVISTDGYALVHLRSHGTELTAYIGSGRVGLDYGETTNPVIDTYDLRCFLEEVDRVTRVHVDTDAALKSLRESGRATGWELLDAC